MAAEQYLGGRYEIVRQLSHGSFGTTYLAIDKHQPRHLMVVVKRFSPEGNPSPTQISQYQQYFEREAQLLQDLGKQCEFIPELYAYFEENGQFYIVQEFIEGDDLTVRLIPRQPLTESATIETIRGILEPLAFLHQKNIIHRDLKPSNIRIRQQDGKLVLIDFGVAKQLKAEIVEGTRCGSPGYSPVEQWMGKATAASDVYAVGTIALQALTGILPASGSLPLDDNTGKIDRRHIAASPKLLDFLDRTLATNPTTRYANAQIALHELNRLSRFPGISTVIQVEKTPAKPFLNRTKIAILFGSITCLAIGFAAWTFWPRQTWVTYSRYGIQLQHPSNWQLDPVDPESNRGDLAILYPPGQRDSPCGDRVFIRKVTEHNPPLTSLENYKNDTIDGIRKSNQQVQLSDATTADTKLAGLPAFRLNYQHQDPQCGRQQSINYGTIYRQNSYEVNLRIAPGNLSQNSATMKRLLDSLQLTDARF
jgi:eukaryotic-like serine/threonine-protein kinase